DLHDRLRDVHLDPDLRRIADARGRIAQAHAALGDERETVAPFVGHLEFKRRLGVLLRAFHLPAAAVKRHPQLDDGNTGFADVLQVVIEDYALTVDVAHVHSTARR